MHFDFSFVPNYLPYYLEGVKYTLLISLITVFLELYLDLYYFYEDFKFSYLENQTFKDISSNLYWNS